MINLDRIQGTPLTFKLKNMDKNDIKQTIVRNECDVNKYDIKKITLYYYPDDSVSYGVFTENNSLEMFGVEDDSNQDGETLIYNITYNKENR